MNITRQLAVWCGTGLCFGLAAGQQATMLALAAPTVGVTGAGAAGALARALERRQAAALGDWRAAAIAYLLAAESFRRRPTICRVMLLRETMDNLARNEQALSLVGLDPPDLTCDARSKSLLQAVRGTDVPD